MIFWRRGRLPGPPIAATRVEPDLAPVASSPTPADIPRQSEAMRDPSLTGVNGHRLPYAEAAARLVAWMQARGETGELTLNEIRVHYARHCEDEGLAWLPENKLLEALVAHIGAERRHERRVPRADGVRERVRTYDIPPPVSTARAVRRIA